MYSSWLDLFSITPHNDLSLATAMSKAAAKAGTDREVLLNLLQGVRSVSQMELLPGRCPLPCGREKDLRRNPKGEAAQIWVPNWGNCFHPRQADISELPGIHSIAC